jgi:hypothetical protein
LLVWRGVLLRVTAEDLMALLATEPFLNGGTLTCHSA